MQHEPSSLLGNMDVSTKLMGRDTLLMATDKVHSHEPLLQWEFGILKDCAYQAGKPFLAVTTFELVVTIGAGIDMYRTTERADNHLMPSLFSNEIPTSFIIVKMIGKGNKGIKVFKFKFHSLSGLLHHYIPSDYDFLSKKSRLF
jgi:hypothetical protein